MAGLYSRDIDIGAVKERTYTVKDIDTLIKRLETNTTTIEETIEELKKIRTGIGLVLGQEIKEAE